MWWKSMEVQANKDKVWALLVYYAWGKQTYRKFYTWAILIITTVDPIYISQIIYFQYLYCIQNKKL